MLLNASLKEAKLNCGKKTTSLSKGSHMKFKSVCVYIRKVDRRKTAWHNARIPTNGDKPL
ncbi:MAG: hypothetical protein DKT66_06430 [Candidatus Melainabacteria bacterium]|nr:MAG: hypothetical protein DKT66_06430 [Candidatus Melainabacteria bacterium]